ncbi:MAG: GreA/GreB family elongation factor [Verrucomicrobiota bacterium]|nr:GreA/GreB family elongation factor [Verrucomicrobiota bacterium]
MANTGDPDAKRRLLGVNQRIDGLEQSLQSAEVISPGEGSPDVVRFGASVTLRNRSGEQLTYRIVGIDEAMFDEDSVSWVSPIARALTGTRVGERVRFKFPSGEDELTILSIQYPPSS